MNNLRLKAERIETLGDGVFAIAMTLLVLDLKVPDKTIIANNTDLINYLNNNSITFFSFFLSFIQLSIIWVTHHTQFSYIEKTSKEMTWLNILLFLCVSFLPFTTALLSHFPSLKVVVALYWFNNMVGIGLLYLNWQYVIKHNYLRSTPKTIQVSFALKKRLQIALVLFSLGFALSFIINNRLSFVLIILIDLLFILPTKFDRKLRELLRE